MRTHLSLSAPSLVALLAALASPASAGGSFLHVGMNDPATEGFQKYVVGNDPGPGAGNDGRDYWEVDKSDPPPSFYYYFVGQFNATLSGILASPDGWVLSATARVAESSGGAPALTVSDPLTGGAGAGVGDTWTFALLLNASNPNQSQLSFLGTTDQFSQITTLDVSEYHDYEFTLLPGPTAFGGDDVVEVRVDGALVGTVPRTFIRDNNNAQTFHFGDASPSGGSRSRWARVELVAVPEPGRTLLLLVAAAALCAARPLRAKRV
jgi:hypothetical protein